MPVDVDRKVETSDDAKLGEDRAEVMAHGSPADVQPSGDRPVGEPLSHQGHDSVAILVASEPAGDLMGFREPRGWEVPRSILAIAFGISCVLCPADRCTARPPSGTANPPESDQQPASSRGL